MQRGSLGYAPTRKNKTVTRSYRTAKAVPNGCEVLHGRHGTTAMSRAILRGMAGTY